MRCNSLYTSGISCSSACLLPFFNSASSAVISGEERCEGLGSTDMLASEFPGEFGDSKHIAGWRPKKLESAGIWRVPKADQSPFSTNLIVSCIEGRSVVQPQSKPFCR